MLRRFVFAVGFAASIALSAGAAMGQGKSAESLSVEASTLYQAATGMADPRERGRLFYIVQLRIEEIKKSFPQSVVAAQLSFGRYQTIEVAVVTREAQAWASLYPAEAAALQSGANVAGGGGLVPSFGSSTGGQPPSTGGATSAAVVMPTGDIAKLLPGPPKRLAQTEIVRKLREAVVIILDPATGSSGTGFFISPEHLMTNTHVVEGLDRVVVANKTIGVKSATVLYRGMTSVREGSGWKSIGIDTAILKTDGWTNGAYLSFAETVEEGEAITIGGYPGRASEHQDKAYDTFFSLIGNNRLPTPETIPNLKFDFGYVQSVFVKADTGIENLQNGVNTSGGNSGSPIVNRCGSIVAQHYQATNAVLDVMTVEQNGQQKQIAIGDTSKFNYAVSGKEVMTFLRSAHIPFSVVGGECPSAATD